MRNWTLKLVNSDGNIRFTNIQPGGGQTRLSLEVKKPLRIGFTSTEPRIIEFEIKNLILSFNLGLKDTCMTNARNEYSPAEVKLKPTEQKSKIKQQESEILVTINDEVAIGEQTNVTLGNEESVDEQNVIDNFQKIQRLNREGLQPISPTSQLNLDRASSEFEEGMSALNTIFKFKHIYNAVEFATNMNGRKEMSGNTLDAEVCSLTKNAASNPPSQSRVKEWRCFYNRLKHSDENNSYTITYKQGIQHLPSWLPKIRSCAATILTERLNRP